jgi:Ser/Thr protein kinase RdoA (MazF antagonist)
MSIRPYAALTYAGKARRHRTTARAALAAYGLADPTIRQLAIDTNFVFRVDAADGQRFALRVLRNGLHRSGQIDVEMWLVRELVAAGAPVAAPVANLAGEVVTVVEGDGAIPEAHRCVLFEWLPGSLADDEPLTYWTAAGELAARLHLASAALDIPAGFSPIRWDSVFAYFTPVLFEPQHRSLLGPGRVEMLRRGIEVLDERLAHRYAGAASPLQMLHGDLHEGNLMSWRGRLVAFDFEDAILGNPVHDLAVMLYGPYYNRADLADVVAAVRVGYERLAPWPIGDIEELADLFAARALGLVDFCIALGLEYREFIDRLCDRVERYLIEYAHG